MSGRTSSCIIDTISDWYEVFSLVCVAVLVCATLAFGRGFSMLGLNILGIRIYVTELVILLTAPLIIVRGRRLLSMPTEILVCMSLYFLFGAAHEIYALSHGYMRALRDVFVFEYVLFAPLCFIFYEKFKKSHLIIQCLVLANVISIISNFAVFVGFRDTVFNVFVMSTKAYISGLFCVFFLNFYIFKLLSVQEIRKRYFFIIIAGFNLYVAVFLGELTILLALFFSVSVWLTLYGKRVLKIFLCILFVFSLCVIALKPFFHDFHDTTEHKIYSALESIYSAADYATVTMPEMTTDTVYRETDGHYDVIMDKLSIDDAYPTVFRNKFFRYLVFSDEKRRGLNSLVWRLDIWWQTFIYSLEHPVLGNGFGTNIDYMVWGIRSDHEADGQPPLIPVHNCWLTIFYKTGAIGLLLFLLIHIFVLLHLKNYLKKTSSGEEELLSSVFLCLLLGTWHVVAFLFDSFDSPPSSIFLWIILGLFVGVYNVINNLEEHSG